MLTFLHGADFHLDSPFQSLPPDQAAERRQEQRQLLTRLASTARETQAQLIFLAGDLFDSQRVRPETLELLLDTLEELEAQVFIAPGNHDPYTAASPYARLPWPSHVHIFSSPYPERVELPHLGAVVYGSAFLSSHRVDSPLLDLQTADEGLVTFGCFHGDTSTPFSRYGPITQEEIARSGLDYLALGHHHTASGIRTAGPTYYAWPGCPEGRGFDETGEKGVLAVTVDDQGAVSVRFVPLAGRRYEIVEADVTGKDSAEEALREVLPASPTGDCCRIILTGQRSFGTPDLAALTALAQPSYFSVSVRDNTRPLRDLWQRAGEDSLTGLVLRALKGEKELEDRELAARFALAALEHGEDPCP